MSASGSLANIFRSDRLLYRAIEDDDEPFLHAIQSDVEALTNSSSDLPVPESKANSRKWKEYLVDKPLIAVIICLPPAEAGAEPQRIGVVSLTGSRQGQWHHRNAYISIDVADGFRGKGYGSEAIRWALDWAFRVAGLHRVGIETYSWNPGACHLYEKLGFTFEGRKRHLYWYNGSWGDFLSYSILEDEWRALNKK